MGTLSVLWKKCRQDLSVADWEDAPGESGPATGRASALHGAFRGKYGCEVDREAAEPSKAKLSHLLALGQ